MILRTLILSNMLSFSYKLVLVVGLALTLISYDLLAQCSISNAIPAKNKPTSNKTPKMNDSVKFEIFNVGYSPLEQGFQPKAKLLVFRDKQAWNNFWASSHLLDINLQKPSAPHVNFGKNLVIALTLGSRPNGGYQVRIERITQIESPQGKQWVVYYTEVIPSKKCLVTQQPTNPTVFVLTEKSNVPISFEGKKIQLNCSQ